MKRPKKSSAHGAGKAGMAGGYTSPTMQTHQQQDGMLREDFLKLGGVAAAGVGAAALGASGFAHAGLPNEFVIPELVAGGGNNYNVWPSGNPDLTEIHPRTNQPCTKDVFHVQFAVDNVREGGFVRLKAHDKQTGEPKSFNFGRYGYVEITEPLTLTGEGGATETIVLPDGQQADVPLTTISGGFRSVRVNTNGQVVIEGLTFKGWDSIAINVITSDNLVIQNNYITSPFAVPSFISIGGPEMNSIMVDEGRFFSGAPPYGDVTGNLTIMNNVIDLYQQAGPFVCMGIAFYRTKAECDIRYNHIYRTASIGIRVVDCNSTGNTNRKTFNAIENIIKPGSDGKPYRPNIDCGALPTLFVNGAKAALIDYPLSWGVELPPSRDVLNSESDATFYVANNTIEVAYEYGWGIHCGSLNYFIQPEHLIENNMITYTRINDEDTIYEDFARPIYLACGNTDVIGNTVLCEEGVLLRKVMQVSCVFVKRGFSGNLFSGNDLSGVNLAPGGSHVCLPAGLEAGTAIDTEVENTVLAGGETLMVFDEDENDPAYGLASQYLPVPGSEPAYYEREWNICVPRPPPLPPLCVDTGGIWYPPFPMPQVKLDGAGNPIVHPKNNSY